MSTRKESLTRRAFAAAAERDHKQISVEAFPSTDYHTAIKKLYRMLAADGDMNLTYTAMDEILARDPETFMRIIAEALGFEEPRRRAKDPARELAAVKEQLAEVQRTLVSLGQQQRELAKVDRAERQEFSRKRA